MCSKTSATEWRFSLSCYKGVLHFQGTELAVFPTGSNLETEDSGLLSLDFSNAFSTVSRTLVLDIWAKIFPEALPFVQTICATNPSTLAAI